MWWALWKWSTPRTFRSRWAASGAMLCPGHGSAWTACLPAGKCHISDLSKHNFIIASLGKPDLYSQSLLISLGFFPPISYCKHYLTLLISWAATEPGTELSGPVQAVIRLWVLSSTTKESKASYAVFTALKTYVSPKHCRHPVNVAEHMSRWTSYYRNKDYWETILGK